MSFWKRLSPKRAVDDFAGHWQQPTPHRWMIMGVAIAATFAVLMVFIPDSERGPPARPDVTYISTWASDRSRTEIISSNLANQERKDERAAKLAAIEEQKKELYRSLGRATFIDVDAMEADLDQNSGAQARLAPAATPDRAPAQQPPSAGVE